MNDNAAELANYELLGANLGWLIILIMLPIAGFIYGRSRAEKSGKKMVWWPVVLALLIDGLALAGRDPQAERNEARSRYESQS